MVEQNNDTDESEVYEFVTKGLHVTFNGLYYYTRSASQTFRPTIKKPWHHLLRTTTRVDMAPRETPRDKEDRHDPNRVRFTATIPRLVPNKYFLKNN